MTYSNTNKIRSLTLNLLLTFFVVLTMLALLEVGARVSANLLGVAPYIAFNPELGWSPRPNSTKIHKKQGNFEAKYTINSLGYRGKLHTKTPNPGVFRIVLLGDSVGFGWGVDDHQTFGALLEELLPGVEVINLSVSGYGTDQELLRLKSEGVAFQPDLVILQVSDNDFKENRRPFMYQRAKPYFLLGDNNKLELNNVPVKSVGTLAQHHYNNILPVPFREWLAWNSYAYTFFNKRYREFMARVEKNSGEKNVAQTEGDITPSSLRWQIFESLVGEMDLELRSRNIKGLILHASQELNGSPKMAELPLTSINLYPLLYELHTKREVSFPNDGHWNPFGHKLVAKKLVDELVSLGLVGK
jgi:lysophospholipase L1-like esterase